MVTLEFISAQRGDVREEGPFEFVQHTYNIVRVGTDGEREIAHFETGWWVHEDGSTWSDLSVYCCD